MNDNNFAAPVQLGSITFGPDNRTPTMESQISVGDIDSDAVGSGARFNEGKPDYSLMIIKDMPVAAGVDERLDMAIHFLGEFQLSGNELSLRCALDYLYEYAQDEADTKYVFESVVRVWEFGKQKYKRWNWIQGMPWSVPIGCALRHFVALTEYGEQLDDDSGQPHWAHLVCNIQMLLQFTRSYPEGNDLPYLVYEKPKMEITLNGTLSNMKVNEELLSPESEDRIAFEFSISDSENQI